MMARHENSDESASTGARARMPCGRGSLCRFESSVSSRFAGVRELEEDEG